MSYLILEIFLFLVLAFALGLLFGWLIWRGSREPSDEEFKRKLSESQSQVRNLQRRVDTLTSERTHHSPVPDRPRPVATPDQEDEGNAEPQDESHDDSSTVNDAHEEEHPTPAPAGQPLSAPSPSGPTAAAFLDDLGETEEETPAPPAPAPLPDPEPATTYDDLQRISGIGPVIERQLAELGVTTYRQIARFSDDDIERVGRHLDVFPDRVRREEWVEQAAVLHRETYGTQP